MPIIDRYQWNKPFTGEIFAGLFLEPPLKQIENSGFKVAVFSYDKIFDAFAQIGINIKLDQKSTESVFSRLIIEIDNLSQSKRNDLKNNLIFSSQSLLNKFKNQLALALDVKINEIIFIPLYGNKYIFHTIEDATIFVDRYCGETGEIDFDSFKVTVIYSNTDTIVAQYANKLSLLNFLEKL